MSIRCRLGRHVALPGAVWNHGLWFSACARCGGELIRPSDGGWRAIPPRHSVVWKPRGASAVRWEESTDISFACLSDIVAQVERKSETPAPPAARQWPRAASAHAPAIPQQVAQAPPRRAAA